MNPYFDYLDYRKFLNDRLEHIDPLRGRFRRLSGALKVSTTLVSQVMNGTKDFTLEMASDAADYLGLSTKESDYFLLLIQLARSSHARLNGRLKQQLERLRKEGLEHNKILEKRLPTKHALSDNEKSIFYSSWTYAGIRNLSGVPGFQNIDTLAERLELPKAKVQTIVQFLLETGLCLSQKDKAGRDCITPGPQSTHLGAQSPHIARHHHNWRLQGMRHAELGRAEDLFYSGPMSLSEKVAEKIRREILTLIEQANQWVAPAPSELVRCLNIDWFEY